MNAKMKNILFSLSLSLLSADKKAERKREREREKERTHSTNNFDVVFIGT
jgi:hypothetical protein